MTQLPHLTHQGLWNVYHVDQNGAMRMGHLTTSPDGTVKFVEGSPHIFEPKDSK